MTEVGSEHDEIIFDYLEGNLSLNEKKAFEALLSSDDALRAAVRGWKQTYMVESFPATAHLEKQILGSVKRTRWFFSLNVFTAVLLFTFIPAPVDDVTTHHSSQTSEKIASMSLVEKHADVNPIHLPLAPVTYAEPLRKPITEKKVEVDATGSVKTNVSIKREDMMISLPVPETLPLKMLSRSVRIYPSAPVRLQSTARVKRFSWKETRAINRKKRKDYQRKIESKFLEGNVPYVVPLDLSNF